MFQRIKFSTKTVPLALLAVCVISFGLLIFQLGFYWDDWPVVLMTRWQGAHGFWEFYQYDRPYSSWTYIVFAPLLGTRPLNWQIFTLGLRCLTVLMMWTGLRNLWPGRTREVTWMAILFVVYPIFDQQTVSVAYSQHWLCFLLYFLSIWLMIKAIKSDRWYWPLTAGALLLQATHLLTMEYFLGLEILRPFFIWVLLDVSEKFSLRLRKTFVQWLPYLFVTVAYIIWRMFFIRLAGEDPNSMRLLNQLLSFEPGGFATLFQFFLQDFTYMFAGSWLKTVSPDQVDISRLYNVLALLVSVITALLVGVYLGRLKNDDDAYAVQGQSTWIIQALIIGFVAAILGIVPAWMTGKQLVVGLYGGRLGMASMFGMSILFVAILEWFSSKPIPKIVFLAVLVGLAINFHFHVTDEYRHSWERQRQFYWQLFWRAPYIKPDTAIISDGEMFLYVGGYSTATAINLLYPEPENSGNMPYWFFSMGRELYKYIPQMIEGMPLQDSLRTFRFTGNSRDSLVVFYAPEWGRCTQVLTAMDADDAELPSITRRVLSISDVGRITATGPIDGWTPPESIFGPEPPHDWCYYYEKASLAAQYKDWAQVVTLGKDVDAQGYRPDFAREWLPFIEAYARTGDWEQAQKLSIDAYRVDLKVRNPFCSLWNALASDGEDSVAFTKALTRVKERLKCVP
jgi:hypothetical protein